MVLETTILCLDNSEWMRNGDYAPSRLEAQQDAATLICHDRTNGNPENTVGVLAMAGQSGVDLITSPTEDQSKLLACLARVKLAGKSDISSSIQIAQLALKYRKNPNGGKRIIIFIGSPVTESQEELEKVASYLRRNGIAIDIISIGEIEENQPKMAAFVNTVNIDDNSHLISVPAGVSPTDAIRSSPLMMSQHGFGGGLSGDTSAAGGFGATGGVGGEFDEYGGIDPSLDPELAMAIRVSTEEARAREEARNQAATEESKNQPSVDNNISSDQNDMAVSMDENEEDEEALLQKALAMSYRDVYEAPQIPTENKEEDEEEEALRMALEISMQQNQNPSTSSTSKNEADSTFLDPAFINQLLGSVDVDQNDPLIQAALAQMGVQGKPEDASPETKKRKNEDENEKK